MSLHELEKFFNKIFRNFLVQSYINEQNALMGIAPSIAQNTERWFETLLNDCLHLGGIQTEP